MYEMNTFKRRERVLVAWIGDTDLRLFKDWNDQNNNSMRGRNSFPDRSKLGPVISSLVNSEEYTFDSVVLLDSMRSKSSAPGTYSINMNEYLGWANSCVSKFKRHPADIEIKQCKLEDPTDFSKIYEHAEKVIKDLDSRNCVITVNFTPGTPQMTAVWIALAARFSLTLVQTIRDSEIVKTINLPFRLTGEFNFGKALNKPGEALSGKFSNYEPQPFGDIVYSCDKMKELIVFAKQIARFLSNNRKDHNNGLSVHITGPTGSGKEGIADGIHRASGRKGKFVAVNCAAIPKELFESEMFGFIEGAFTGANFDKTGRFEEADGGTLFLDEIGDIPLDQQTKLLRAIQERKITRTGSSEEISIDVNIITATHKNLGMMVEEKTFREDLFYRLTTVILEIPSLKARGKEDIKMLLDFYLKRFNENYGASKNFSEGALEVFLNHSWPGNVRELQSTIIRAAIFSDEKNEISKSMAQKSLIFRESPLTKEEPSDQKASNKFMPVAPDVNGYVNLQSVLDEVELAYVNHALEKTDHNKSKAASLLGYGNYQTLENRRNKIRERKEKTEGNNLS